MECDFGPGGWCGRLLGEIAAAGATNYVALDLKWAGAPATGVLSAIAAGAADGEIARIARQFAGMRQLLLLEPGWEMNGNWSYTWQGIANGADQRGPQRYVAAWRRIVDIFRREGATNVRWVFNPNTGNPVNGQGAGRAHWNWYANYYPGDAYVDYVGAHGFNGSTAWGGRWQDFATMFESAHADYMLMDLATRYPSKPIIIGELASDDAPGHNKGEWISEAFRRLRSHPNVVGAVWFNMNKEADWRVNSSPQALEAYRAAMREPGIATTFQESPPSATRLASQ
jgi:hypothetical protein